MGSIIDEANRQKAYEDKKRLAAASNVGYGLSFEGDLGGDDPLEKGELNTTKNWLNSAGYASGGIGAFQIGMLNYRESLSLISKVGTFSNFSTTYKFLGTTSKILGGASTYVGAPLSVYCDYQSLKQPKGIGIGRFTYRQTGLGASIVTGLAIGGPWGAAGGALVSGGFWAGEQIYDVVTFTIDKVSQFSSDINNAISSGTWYPGR